MPSFNLAFEPWIPCLMPESIVPEELSLFDTLRRAHEIREISDDSPLVTVALHRLLLAILHRNFGPTSFSEWKKLWRRGQWDADRLAAYFEKWKSRFDLFDTERPFYQVQRMRKSVGQKPNGKKAQAEQASQEQIQDVKSDPLTLLAQELASGNNATLFDHSFNAYPQPFPPEQAARFLLSRQAFAFSGTGGYLNSPLVGGYTVLILGNNLFETLALNLLDYNEELPVVHRGEDLPCWEQEKPERFDKDGTLPHGYLDYLTWQSRQIHLIPEGEPPVVRYCQHAQNLKLKDERGDLDPFKCYDRDSKGAFKVKRLNPARALWRDCHALFQQTDGSTKKPEVFNHLAQIEMARRRGEIEAQPAYAFAVYGMVNDQASVEMWARERLPLPLSYLIEKQLTSALGDALKLTEKVEDNLKDAIRTLARNLVGDQEAGTLAESYNAKEFYWSRLGAPFKKFLTDLAREFEQTQEGELTLTQWAQTVVNTARDAVRYAINSLGSSARELHAASQAESEFARSLGKTRKSFSHLFPKSQTERR